MKFALALPFITGMAAHVGALRCGKPLTTDCIGNGDIRYDPDYTNDVLQQASVWKHAYGGKFLMSSSITRDKEGNPINAAPYDSASGTFGRGTLTNLVGQKAFTNQTAVGSRIFQHCIVVTPPVPKEYCVPPAGLQGDGQSGGPPQLAGVDADIVCGVNGRLIFGDAWGTSTYEKDGTIEYFKGLGWWAAVQDGYLTPIDSRSYTILSHDVAEGGDANVQFATSATYYDDFAKKAGISSLSNFLMDDPIQSVSTTRHNSTDNKEEWLDSILSACKEYNVTSSQMALLEASLPMATECFFSEECATEEEFCTIGKDPTCSESPYQEPSASLNGGGIALITVLCTALVAAIAYALHHRAKTMQENRMKLAFVRSIAKTMNRRVAAESLSVDDLKVQFETIDTGKNGTISMDELSKFLDDQDQTLDDQDFKVLWNAIDLDGENEIDFSEFVAFYATVRGDYNEQSQHQSIRMQRASWRSLRSNN